MPRHRLPHAADIQHDDTVAPHGSSGKPRQYEARVYQALIKLGAGMPDPMIRAAGNYVENCKALGIEPEITAAALYAAEKHRHQVSTTTIQETRAPSAASEGDPSAMEDVAAAAVIMTTTATTPSTDCTACIPWVKVTRDTERYEACVKAGAVFGPIEGPADVFRLLGAELAKEDQEVFLTVMLDVHRHLRGVCEVARGQRDRVTVSPGDILRPVIVAGASSFIVVHNHPSSRPRPSRADIALTDTIRTAADPFRETITFVDHVIVGATSFYSIIEKKLTKVKAP